jgi:selenocysteine lyase/cysteine desulfurase
LPRRSAEALRKYVDDRERLFHLYQADRQDYDITPLRSKLGRLLGGVPGERVAFVPTTTDGMGAALNAVDWRPGDNVVVPANEFPGVLYGCLVLARRGIAVRQVPVEGHLDLARLADHVDSRTRAVAVSHVHWQSGHRIDLAELGRICAGIGALSIVDAIQSLGQTPVEPEPAGIDVVVAGSYKWLMAVPGTAVFYTSERALRELTPDRAGWTSMQTSVHGVPALVWAADASRFHVGGQCDPTLIALEPSVDLLLEVGVDAIARHTTGLLDRLVRGLPAGLAVHSSLRAENRSAIVSIGTGDVERDDRLARDLVAKGVIVSRRGGGIRVSPHGHSTEADIDRLVEALAALR